MKNEHRVSREAIYSIDIVFILKFKIHGLRDADSGRHTQNRREKVVDLKNRVEPWRRTDPWKNRVHDISIS